MMLYIVIGAWLLLILFVRASISLHKREAEAAPKATDERTTSKAPAQTYAQLHNVEQFSSFR